MVTKKITNVLYKVSGGVFLLLAVITALVPFLGARVLRMAGDEKVYVSQAIEMARGGRWFVQTLAGEPSYFKGPLHYILVRMGMIVFGNSLYAGTWMNALFAILAGYAMYTLGRKRWNDKSGLLLGLATSLNVGVVSHAYVSQMEVEVCAFYAIALAFLGLGTLGDRKKYDYYFWLTAGIAGWSKSPLYSAMIGGSGLIYWLISGELASRLRSLHFWLAGIAGVVIGVLGYLPAYFTDRENFIATYIVREQFQKANNNRAWHYVMTPLIHFSLPWTFAVFLAIGTVFKKKKIDRQMLKLAAAMALPTMFFWMSWTYKGQNYTLPTMSAILLFTWACFNGSLPRSTTRAAGVVGAIAVTAALAVFVHFWPLPGWWGFGWMALAIVSMLLFSIIFIIAEDVRLLGVGAVAFFISFAAFIAPLGEREMIGMRQFIREHPDVTYHYYDLDPSIWSEWSLLQLSLHRPIFGLHKPAQLEEAVQPGHAVLVQNSEWLNVVLNFWKQKYNPMHREALPPQVVPWERWLTKGRTADGQSRWSLAWETHDLHQLEREFFIIWFPVKTN